MNKPRYERLSGLDQAFLHFETPNTYMHVALTAVFDPGSLVTPGAGIDIKRIRRHIASRLHLIPRYRQKLQFVPVTNDAVWVDDPHFDLEYHVRHTSIPSPGSDRQLQTAVARLLERALDRSRPLWETWFIEGLAEGRFAMLSKVHHCMVDGIAGVDLLAALLAVGPHAIDEKPVRWHPVAAPTTSELLRDDVGRRARAGWQLLKGLPSLWRNNEPVTSDFSSRLSALWELLQTGLPAAAQTPFNQPIGPHRRVVWFRLPLADLKAVKARLDGTLNDIVLTTVAGALRRYLRQHGHDTSGIELRTAVPVSVRSDRERGQTGNRVSVWLTPLPLDEADPRRCFRLIHAMTARSRSQQHALGAEMLTQTADWTTSLVVGAAARLLTRARLFNLIVTNVPGPPMPLYLLDAPLVAAYPHVPLFENQGLGIALFSYAEHLYWGLVSDWDVVPDIHELSECVQSAFAELQTAVGLAPPRAEARKRRGPARAA